MQKYVERLQFKEFSNFELNSANALNFRAVEICANSICIIISWCLHSKLDVWREFFISNLRLYWKFLEVLKENYKTIVFIIVNFILTNLEEFKNWYFHSFRFTKKLFTAILSEVYSYAIICLMNRHEILPKMWLVLIQFVLHLLSLTNAWVIITKGIFEMNMCQNHWFLPHSIQLSSILKSYAPFFMNIIGLKKWISLMDF